MWLEMKKMKYLLTSLGFRNRIYENNEVAMRLDQKKRNRMTKRALISVSDKAVLLNLRTQKARLG